MAALVLIQKIENSAGNIGTPLDTPKTTYKMKIHLPYIVFTLDFSTLGHSGKIYRHLFFRNEKILVLKKIFFWKKNFLCTKNFHFLKVNVL